MGAVGDIDSGEDEQVTSRYPENQMWFGGSHIPVDPEFARLREEFLVDFGYNTARAYWGDLQDVYDWAVGQQLDPLALTTEQLERYVGLLHKRGYGESTIRRRWSIYRRFRDG